MGSASVCRGGLFTTRRPGGTLERCDTRSPHEPLHERLASCQSGRPELPFPNLQTCQIPWVSHGATPRLHAVARCDSPAACCRTVRHPCRRLRTFQYHPDRCTAFPCQG